MNVIQVPPIPTLQVPSSVAKPQEIHERVRSQLEIDFKNIAKEQNKLVYSYSRLGNINECEYGYYKTYIERNRGKDNIYSYMGGICHEVLEDYTNGKITKEEMLPKFEKTYAKAKLANMKFPSEKIEKAYIENLRLFFQEYEIPNIGIPITEMFVCGVFGGVNKIFMQGFIDEVYCCKDKEGKPYAIISDHKSSSKFQKKDLLKYGRQLALYSVMYERLTGLKVKYVQWNMMKYAECTVPSSWYRDFCKLTSKEIKEFLVSDCGIKKEELKGLKKAELVKYGIDYKDKVCDRFEYNGAPQKIVYDRKDVASKLERHLKWANVSQEVIDEFKTHNLWSKIPEDVKIELRALDFNVEPYYEKYEINDEIVAEMENYIIDSVNLIESKVGQPEIMYKPKDIASDGFFCTNLCGFRDVCLHYKAFVKRRLSL